MQGRLRASTTVILVDTQEGIFRSNNVDQLEHSLPPFSSDKVFVNDVGGNEDLLVIRISAGVVLWPICIRRYEDRGKNYEGGQYAQASNHDSEKKPEVPCWVVRT
jgi:hypothetical protein